MSIKKLPYWLKGGVVTGIIGTLVFFLFPNKFYGNEVPWYLHLFSSIAFIIFMPIALLFRIDFISEAASPSDRDMASVISCFSFFVSFYIVGALATIIMRKAKSKMSR
jgi:integral membrane sensor domain MASE1